MHQVRENLFKRTLWCVLALSIGCSDGDGDASNDQPLPEADMMVSQVECTADDECGSSEYCSDANTCETGCRQNPTSCEEGFVCAPERVCVSDAECVLDVDCAANQYCVDGACEVGCRVVPDSCAETADGETQLCDPTTRMCSPTVNCCVPGSECEPRLPFDCPEQGCAEDGECPGEQTCVNSTCVEPTTCTADIDCFGDRYCDDNLCINSCAEDADCAGADQCVDGRCVHNASCFADGDCAAGRVCIDTQCMDGCTITQNCADDDVCDADSGRCVSDTECRGDVDCRDGEICTLESLCVVGCRMDAECISGQRCNLETNACERDVECTLDSECLANQRCRGNVCGPECDATNLCSDDAFCTSEGSCQALPACASDADCGAGSCEGGVCRVCSENSDCSGADICLALTGQCIEPCVDDSACGLRESCDLNSGACIAFEACIDDTSCESSQVCNDASGVCEAEGACVVDDDCRAGRVCAAGGCVDACDDAANPCDAGFGCNATSGRCESLPGCLGGLSCQGSRICDQQTGACPERTHDCFTSLDCDAGRICDCAGLNDSIAGCVFPGGRCIADCATAGCQSGACNSTSGLCEDAAGVCTADVQCVGRRICNNGACQSHCDDAGCPSGGVCDADTGRCEDESRCVNSSDCSDGAVCDQATSQCRGCRGVSECPNQFWSCDAGRCVPPVQCFFPEDCPGQVCNVQTGECLDACAGAQDCPGQQICSAAQICEEAGCTDATAADDCFAESICLNGACAPRCEVGTCANGQTCNEASGKCEFAAGFCAVNDDCDVGRFCVDGVCAVRIPNSCSNDQDCTASQTCSPFGQCVVQHTCGGDDGCPGGVAACVNNRCMPCAVDIDCGQEPGFFCDDNRCDYEAADCTNDTDCPVTRICQDGFCQASGCGGDEFDVEGLAELQPRTYLSLLLCDGDEDRYQVQTAAGEGVLIRVVHEPVDGDLSVSLLVDGTEVDYADTPYGVETVSTLATDEPRTVEVVILGAQGRATQYDLTVQTLDDGTCAPDGSEGAFNNDAVDRATELAVGTTTISSCANDVDWYDIPAGPGTDVSLVATATDAPINMSIFTAGQEAGEAVATGANISYATGANNQGLSLRIDGDATQGQSVGVNVSVAAAEDGAARACEGAVVVPNDGNGSPYMLPYFYPVEQASLSCFPDGAGDVQDHFVRFTPAFGGEYMISSSLYAAFELFTGVCGNLGASIACGETTTPQIVNLQAGVEVILLVKTPAFYQGDIVITPEAP